MYVLSKIFIFCTRLLFFLFFYNFSLTYAQMYREIEKNGARFASCTYKQWVSLLIIGYTGKREREQKREKREIEYTIVITHSTSLSLVKKTRRRRKAVSIRQKYGYNEGLDYSFPIRKLLNILNWSYFFEILLKIRIGMQINKQWNHMIAWSK